MNARRKAKSGVFEARDLRPVQAWLREPHADLEVREAPPEETVETYYETLDWRFHRAGLALSACRRKDAHEARTIPIGKAPLAAARGSLADDSIEALNADNGVVGDRVRALSSGTELRRLFQLRSTRQKFQVRRNGTRLATVTLDALSIPLSGQDEPVRLNRVEVDATVFDDPSIGAWVEALRRSFGMHAGSHSRHAAALMALGLAPPSRPDLGSTDLSTDLSTAETAYAVLRQQFHKCLAHDPGTRIGEDIEQLHDMRVATRRMRAAIRLFEDYLPRRLLVLQRELSWLGSSLGEVRDLDVQLAQFDSWRQELEERDRGALDSVVEIIRSQWIAARRRMLRALGSRRYTRLVERMTAVLAQGPATSSRTGRTPILSTAPDLIRGRFKRVVKPGKRITKTTPEEPYHRLRARCKALRYAMEFHRTLYGSKAEPMIRRLVALQDLLGDHQDAAVASASLRSLVEQHGRRLPPQTAFVVGILSERYSRRARALRTGYPRAFARMQGRRWKRLVRTMNALRPAAPVPSPPKPKPPKAPAVDEAESTESNVSPATEIKADETQPSPSTHRAAGSGATAAPATNLKTP